MLCARGLWNDMSRNDTKEYTKAKLLIQYYKKLTAFSVVMLCSLAKVYRSFGNVHRLHHHCCDDRAECTCGISENFYQTTQHNGRENSCVHCHENLNLKYWINTNYFRIPETYNLIDDLTSNTNGIKCAERPIGSHKVQWQALMSSKYNLYNFKRISMILTYTYCSWKSFAHSEQG